MKTKRAIFHLLSSIFVFLAGCKTLTPDQVMLVQRNAQAAAYAGTSAAIAERPEWKSNFEASHAWINTLVARGHVTPVDLAEFMTTLKIKELKSQEVRLGIVGARTVYLIASANTTTINADVLALAAATGIRDGMGEALGNAP